MKHLFKKILAITVACLCVCSLASCGNGIKGDEAKALINDFFVAIVAEDYDKAESFLHPERPADLDAHGFCRGYNNPRACMGVKSFRVLTDF